MINPIHHNQQGVRPCRNPCDRLAGNIHKNRLSAQPLLLTHAGRMAEGNSNNDGAKAGVIVPTHEELKDAIKEFKTENPDSSAVRTLKFVRTEKAWQVSEIRVKRIFAELGYLKIDDSSAYLESRMESLLASGTGDLRFVVGSEREIVVGHSILVNHNCPSLLQLYPPKEDKTVELSDVSVEAFKAFLDYLYIARLKSTTIEVALELFRFAKKVDDARLCGASVDYIISDVTVDTVCDIFCACLLHNEADANVTRLRQYCGRFFHSHQVEVRDHLRRHCRGGGGGVGGGVGGGGGGGVGGGMHQKSGGHLSHSSSSGHTAMLTASTILARCSPSMRGAFHHRAPAPRWHKIITTLVITTGTRHAPIAPPPQDDPHPPSHLLPALPAGARGLLGSKPADGRRGGGRPVK